MESHPVAYHIYNDGHGDHSLEKYPMSKATRGRVEPCRCGGRIGGLPPHLRHNRASSARTSSSRRVLSCDSHQSSSFSYMERSRGADSGGTGWQDPVFYDKTRERLHILRAANMYRFTLVYVDGGARICSQVTGCFASPLPYFTRRNLVSPAHSCIFQWRISN